MIKKFSEHINEDYFSKLASRKDNGNVRKENGKTFVDIDGSFYLRRDAEEIPFQFGKVSGDFDCDGCYYLTSLKGCPKEVYNIFNCDNCTSLKSLEGCPEKVGLDFYCIGCGKQFAEEEVKSLCDVKRKIYV